MNAMPFLSVLTYPQIDPVFLQVGPIALRWYGLAYVAGILCGWLYGRALVSNPRLWPGGRSPLTREDIDDFIVWITIGIVAGGRIGHILFYDFARIAADPEAHGNAVVFIRILAETTAAIDRQIDAARAEREAGRDGREREQEEPRGVALVVEASDE